MRIIILLLAVLMLGAVNAAQTGLVVHPQDSGTAHIRWVAGVLKQIGTITPGMTRKDLKSVFTTEGGLSTGLRRTYVTRECPYFKVDVGFRAVGRPERDRDGRVTLLEDDRDLITTISRPYLQFSIVD